MNDNDLDTLLDRYITPDAPDGLADRIINAASQIEPSQTFWDWLSGLCEEFRLPAPAFSLACLLLISVAAGYFNDSAALEEESTQESVTYALYEEGWLL